mgnify:CR=1 FL=1
MTRKLVLSGKPLSNSKLGKKNPMWKCDKVGYMSLHELVRNRKKKPEKCESCQTEPPRDLANISQQYKRDLSDWEYLCRRCHMKKDGRMLILKKNNDLKKVIATLLKTY